MKKSQKQVDSLRKLRLHREVIAELKLPQLIQVDGGLNAISGGPPRCSEN